jgi:uncharacterized membrane protein
MYYLFYSCRFKNNRGVSVMSINPDKGQNPDPTDPYGSYRGYAPTPPTPPTPPAQPVEPNPDDPYNSQWYGQQPTGGYYDPGQQQQQQYGTGQQQQTYQAPRSAYASSNDPSGPSTMKMNPRTAALLSNALIWVGGLFFFFAERKNRFVRFNAAQSFLFFGSVSIVFSILKLLGFLTLVPLLGWFFGLIFGLISFVLLLGTALVWIFLMLRAYTGKKFKLPFFGDYAEKLVNRFTK